MALEESVDENEDQVEETEGVSFVFEKKVLPHLNDKIIDYVTTPQEGFMISKENPDTQCGSCSC